VTPLIGYAPGVSVTTPGAMMTCASIVPTDTGLRADGTPEISYAGPSTSNHPVGFAILDVDNSTHRTFYGTEINLYEYNGSTWDDRSRGGAYSLSDGVHWSFAQFGATSLASNIDTVVQSSASGAAFADISGAPKAAILVSVLTSAGGFVLAFNTIDGTYGTRTDAWWCCAANDVTTWTPSIARQCATGRLVSQDGPILAAKRLGVDMVVAYKRTSFYVGRYVGGDVVWQWQEYTGWGCLGLDGVADIGGGAHFSVDSINGAYIFDGVRPFKVDQQLGFGYFTSQSSITQPDLIKIVYQRNSNRVRIYYSNTGFPTYTTTVGLAYSLTSKMWGRSDLTCGPMSISTANNGLYIVIPTGSSPAYSIYRLTGDATSSSFTTNWFGDDKSLSMLNEVLLRYNLPSFTITKSPTAASVQAYSSMWLLNTRTTGPSASYSDDPGSHHGRFTLRQTARWHQLEFTLTGNHEIIGFDAKLKPVGGSR
jgi:hypothetical protein